MGKVSADISMSLDGYIAGLNDTPEQGLGENGEKLHEWVYGLAGWREPHGLEGGTVNRDSEIMEEGFKSNGAIIIGRRMFDLSEQPWGDTPPFHMPVFVVTHRAKDKLVKQGGTTFTFVDGIENALQQAKAAAGNKDVGIGGGASVIQQFIKAGLLDELQIHLVSLLLGAGRRLFDPASTGQVELQSVRVVESPAVTHLRYRIVK